MSFPVIVRLIAASAVMLAVGLAAACGDGDDVDPTPTPTLIASPTAEPLGTPTPTPPPPATAYRLIYREAGATEDVIWAAVPENPALRQELLRLPHREGFPVLASISPDGRLLAYLALPDSARSAESSQAEAYVYDLARRETAQVAVGVDYQFRPVWSPDGRLLYMRRYAGFDILSADVSLVYTRITPLPHPNDPPTPRPTPTPSPSPSPTLPPDVTPTPGPPPGTTPTPSPTPEDPIKTMFKARYSQVMSWIPIGFDADGKSMYFVQVNGGLSGVTVVGSVTPATLAGIDEANALWTLKTQEIMQLFPSPPPEATPAPPDAPPTPSLPPSPTPATKLIAELTRQTAADYTLSADTKRLAFRASAIEEGDFRTRVFVADLVSGTVTQVPDQGLPPGDQAGAAWHPDGQRLVVGVLPAPGYISSLALLNPAGGHPVYLHVPETGFDIPRIFSPDGVWLATSRFSGESLVNPGEASLDLVAPTGQRVNVGIGGSYANGDAIIGWVAADKLPSPPTPAPTAVPTP